MIPRQHRSSRFIPLLPVIIIAGGLFLPTLQRGPKPENAFSHNQALVATRVSPVGIQLNAPLPPAVQVVHRTLLNNASTEKQPKTTSTTDQQFLP